MTEQLERCGTLFVVSAPSGTGKSTVVPQLMALVRGVEFSVSYTTRARRTGEQDGRDYHFVDDGRFDAMVAQGAFIEWAPVFGRRYGTGRAATERLRAKGRDLILDIDVQGAAQVRECDLPAVSIFLMPPDFPTLEARLRDRRSEGDAELAGRLSVARREAEEYTRYDYLVVNDDVDRAVEGLRCILEARRKRVASCRKEAERILSTFPTERESR